MENSIVFQLIVLIAAGVFLVRGLLKLPKRVAIITGSIMVATMIAITYMAFYEIDTLNNILRVFNKELVTD